ncbi:hypothetical protein DXG01_009826 [Tephrocybe rancida]|nr:hypothetical protein DXG01_009826 [Tephrocybe rancida]
MQYNATPGPSTLPRLMTPGLLDRGQNARVRRHLDSTLSFAMYDHYTARSDGMPDFEQLSLKDELHRSARVVIETLPSGVSTWRFVPKARKANGVHDEGIWPRPVEICGNFFECSQEQWDIYKLDPLYRCYVRESPACPIISRRADSPLEEHRPTPQHVHRPASPPPSPRPRKKTVSFETESEDEYDEVEGMIIDDGYPRASSAGPSSKSKGKKKAGRSKLQTDRGQRRTKTAKRTEHLSHENGSPQAQFTFGGTSNGRSKSAPAQPAPSKRKVDSLYDSLRNNGDHNDPMRPMEDTPLRSTANFTPIGKSKRTRTTSPGEITRHLQEKKNTRREAKMKRMKEDLDAWRHARQEERLQDAFYVPSDVEMTDAPLSQGTVDMNSPTPERQDEPQSEPSAEKTPVPDDIAPDPQAAHDAAIEASRRKLAELEKDRGLWEAAAARRQERERKEEEALKREAAARRHTMEVEKRKPARRAEDERKRQEEAAREQTPAPEAAYKESQRQLKIQSWHQQWFTREVWSDGHAFQRYVTLLKEFGDTLYKPGVQSMTVLDVPWPILDQTFTLTQVTAKTVTDFFSHFRQTLPPEDFKMLLKKSSLRFHPDHWINRLSCVAEPAERELISEGKLAA